MLPITFLSDYGYRDEFAGVCHGVIERIAPGATVIDLTHGIPPQDVRAGAFVLRNALPYVPSGVHLAVVDPGVGTVRRALALRCADGRLFVGPDNGLLWPAAERCGGVEAAVDIAESRYRLEPVSATFHGRDVFAPVAAQLALGTPLEQVGTELEPERIRTCELPSASVVPGEVSVHVLAVDRFGNLQLALERSGLEGAGFGPGDQVEVEAPGGNVRATVATTFADVEEREAVVFEDASGMIAVALNGADAAAALGAGADAELTLRAFDR